MTEGGLLARLESGVLLMDGGMGTLLISRGLEQGQAPEEWLLEHPERVLAAHQAYVDAGSDVIQTNTFGGASPKLALSPLLRGRVREVNAAAVGLAREAAGSKALVAGDIGPTGLLLPPVGDASSEHLRRAFGEQAEALAEAGADLLAVETMYDLREALTAVEAAHATGLPVFGSMTFDRSARRDAAFTIMGNRVGSSLRAMAEAGADVVGFNCSVGSDRMAAILREAVDQTSRPLIVQPNAGQPRGAAQGIVYDATPEAFLADVLSMVDLGARVVGGCCGTTPAFIQRIRAALDARNGA